MNSNDIRKLYISFFTKRGHREIPSAPLVPENDPTTLFTSSGMQPLIPYLLGQPHPLGRRLVDSQKSFRAQDIGEVGDNRHTTFFEMLGNWSLGDYFKKEQLPWNFEFLTNVLGLDPKRLYVSVFEGEGAVAKDRESIEIWKQIFSKAGIDAKEGIRIIAYPASKNWWSRSGEPKDMPAGEPGGPDSEVFFDFGEDLKLHEQSPYKDQLCHPNCQCGRYMEIANSVFMQYQKSADGSLIEMPQKNVDFGGGLERLTTATENTQDIFQTDLFSEILSSIQKIFGAEYAVGENKPALQVIADHLKAAAFLIADGVTPSNKTQGYILRRLLRRTAIKLRLLRKNPLPANQYLPIIESIIHTYKDTAYFTHINPQQIQDVVGIEMNKFASTLDKGLREIRKIQLIDGKIAFDLYQTFGFPIEITKELFSDKGQTIDHKQFIQEFDKHRDLSRSASKRMFKGGLADHSKEATKLHTATHLLHAALRKVLGLHVQQKGSNITADRLRFDFSHPQKVTHEELQKIEDLVNSAIIKNLSISFARMEKEKALAIGALAFFSEKYSDIVKVYTVGDPHGTFFSREICGGPHVSFTGELGHFTIMKEESVSAGIRRIYAACQHHEPAKTDSKLASKKT